MTSKDHAARKKQKVTLSIDSDIWRRFITKVIWDSGQQKTASRIVERLLREYLEKKRSEGDSNPQSVSYPEERS